MKEVAVSAFLNQVCVLRTVYITANVSGGHLNPAVTVATVITGHLKFLVGVAYVILQISGACIGTLILVSVTINAVTTYCV
jgi:aquaporin TIP